MLYPPTSTMMHLRIMLNLYWTPLGPNIALFERFWKYWPIINQVSFAPVDDARNTDPQLQQLGAEVGLFFQSFLTGETYYLPREDYQEIIELSFDFRVSH